MVYLDDILVHTSTWQQHQELLARVLQRLGNVNLKLQLQKCKWAQQELKFLGFSQHGISIDDEKVAAINNFPTPHNVK